MASGCVFTSDCINSFINEKVNQPMPDTQIPPGTFHEGYWGTVKISLQTSTDGPLWDWRSVARALNDLELYFELSGQNSNPIKAEITSNSGSKLTFTMSIVSTTNFNFGISNPPTSNIFVLGKLYREDVFDRAACMSIMGQSLRYSRAYPPDDIIPAGDLKVFSAGEVALTTSIGGWHQYRGLSYREYEILIRGILKVTLETQYSDWHGMKGSLMDQEIKFGTIELSRGYFIGGLGASGTNVTTTSASNIQSIGEQPSVATS